MSFGVKQMDVFREKGLAASLTKGKDEASVLRVVLGFIFSTNVTRIWHNSLNNRYIHTHKPLKAY